MATTQSAASMSKGKKNWFASLSLGKKSLSQQDLSKTFANTANSEETTESNLSEIIVSNSEQSAGADGAGPPPTSHSLGNDVPLCTLTKQEDTNDSMTRAEGFNEQIGRNCGGFGGSKKKRKDEQTFFQRFRKKMGLRLSSFRLKHNSQDVSGVSGTEDASNEFLTRSPVREPRIVFNLTRSNHHHQEEPEIPFTHSYKRFIERKWLENENRIMYKASSEMLNQVWYWGEISRRDAQKQLTDKPTGSFLVRDSETYGSQFTLSFRIVNVTLHYRLEYRDNYWHFEELQYESIVEMIEDILYRCTNDNFVCYVKVPNEMQPPFPVILKYPLSRYLKMPPLQDLCRRVIQTHSTMEQISKLPIPSKLLEYLSEKRELVFQS